MKQNQSSQPLLIEVPESLSPKLVFIRQQGLITKKTSHSRWSCQPTVLPKKGTGRTEADAIIDYCNKNKIKHYNLE